jgi:hypothetical protein
MIEFRRAESDADVEARLVVRRAVLPSERAATHEELHSVNERLGYAVCSSINFTHELPL